jgi:hypothetical protein
VAAVSGFFFFFILLFNSSQVYAQTRIHIDGANDYIVTDNHPRISPTSPLAITSLTVSFQEGVDGYNGTIDTFLEGGAPNSSRGDAEFFEWDQNSGGSQNYALLRFENIFGSGSNQVPDDAIILSAQLQYNVYDTGNSAEVNEATSVWDENVTFNNFPGSPESQGNFVASATGSSNGNYSIDVTSSITNWISSPSLNKGWIFDPTGTNGVEVRSSEYGTVQNRPKLTVTYISADAPNEPVLVSPANGETVTDFPDLQVEVTDPNSDPLTVTFFGREIVTGSFFTLIGLPDTQYYVSFGNGGLPAMFTSQTQWIVNNRDSLNIEYVAQLGDCVQHGDSHVSEWQHADTSISLLEDSVTTTLTDGIPFGIAVGNHDQSPSGNPDGSTARYNEFFGSSRFDSRAYYGGHYGSNNDNHYDLFSAGGMDFIVIYFEYDNTPDQVILDWADSLLTAYSNRRAIAVTHNMLGTGNPGSFSTQGQAIYDALKDHSNLFLMLGGHVSSEGQRTEIYNGNTVHALLSDYQDRYDGGHGLLRIMEFYPASNTINVKTYSPYTDEYETDSDSEFSLNYNMTDLIEAPFTQIGSVGPITSGTTASYNWSGINPSSTYQWYVELYDRQNTTIGPTWSFNTDDPLPVELSSFTATLDDLNIRLDWRTETEVNNYGFEILRQVQDEEWDLLGFVEGHGNTNSPKHYSFIDKYPGGESSYAYRLKQIDNDGKYEYSNIVEINLSPNEFALYQNYPNPFNPVTKINYTLPQSSDVTIKVFDILGSEVETLVSEKQDKGIYEIEFNSLSASGGQGLASGMYIYRMRAGNFVQIKKMVLIK